MTRFTFVVSCGPQSGMGHLSRCLALATALTARGARCRFFLTDDSGLAACHGFQAALFRDLSLDPSEVVIADGYDFTPAQLTEWRSSRRTLVLIDDLANAPFPADLVVNHNLYADKLDYTSYRAAAVLSGPRYALLRPEFATLRSIAPSPQGRVLVSFGGSALAKLGLDVSDALARSSDAAIDAVVPPHALPQSYVAPASTTVHRQADMAMLMGRARLYIGALGVGFLEALAAHRSVIGVQIADNQHLNFTAAKELGLVVHDTFTVDWIVTEALKLLAAPAPSLPEIVDGHGADRVSAFLRNNLSIST